MSEVKEYTSKQIAKIWKKTEEKLAKEGLAPIKSLHSEMKEAGLEGVSYDQEREHTLNLQEKRDRAVSNEKNDLAYVHGLPPCLAAKELDKRGELIGYKDKK